MRRDQSSRRSSGGRFGGNSTAIKGGIAREATIYGVAPELAVRLSSWQVELAEALLPQGTPSYSTDNETRFGRKSSLALYQDGSWHDYEDDAHGHSALSLIAHLQEDATPASVQSFARAWLRDHPGNGAREIQGGNNDASVSAREQARAEWGRRILAGCFALSGNPGERNLQLRGLINPPDGVAGYYPNARTGEGALVGILRKSDGRVLGVQVGYLDPLGRKSALPPQRNRFMIELNPALRKDAAFRISGRPLPPEGSKGNGHDTVPAILPDLEQEQFAWEHADVTLFTEGLENAIALHMAMPYSNVVGYPGIGMLLNQHVRAGQKIVVFKDGDATDAKAVKALIRGTDQLLISEADVRVTNTPAKHADGDVKQDANSVLQAGGIAAVQALITGAVAPSLSSHGEVMRLAAMRRDGEQLRYEQERVAVAKRLGIRRISQLDAQVNRELPPLAEEMEFDPLADLPWEAAITDFGAVLDAALAEVQRFVAADAMYLGASVVWAAHTHLVHSDVVLLPVSPRMLITAVAENSGKSTLLKIASLLSARSMRFVNMTPASLFRVVDQFRPTLFIDEADAAFARGNNAELLALINAGYERGGSVPRVEEVDGVRQLVLFSVWGAVAMAAIGRLPVATTQSRCIVVPLRRAWVGEVPERLRPGMEPVFEPFRRQLVRWAQDLTMVPEVGKMSGLDNRTGDNWETLRQVAELAGGRWPALIARAAQADAEDSSTTGSLVPLLTDIRTVFGALAQLSTTELLEGLLGLEEPSAEWDRVNRGREVTAVWLAKTLRGALPTDAESLRARQWKVGRKNIRGYPVEQFDDAFRRYLRTTGDSETFDTPAAEASAKAGDICEFEPPPTKPEHPGPITATPRERPASVVPGQIRTPGTKSS